MKKKKWQVVLEITDEPQLDSERFLTAKEIQGMIWINLLCGTKYEVISCAEVRN